MGLNQATESILILRKSFGEKSLAKIGFTISVVLFLLVIFLIINQVISDSGNIVFDRTLDCDRCGQHKVPPLTDINMTVTTTVSYDVTGGILIDYFPVEWTIIDANGGDVSSFNSAFNKIEWYAGDLSGSVSKWYVIRSPSLTSPPTKYYFFSELDGEQSDLWFVIVSDPSSIAYNFLTVLSDLTNVRWATNETDTDSATTSDTVLTTSTGEKCWTGVTTYKGMFTVPNFTWSGSGYVLVNGTWSVSAKYRETSGGGGFSSATCRFRAYISKINSTGNYQILMMDNVGGTDVCVLNTDTIAFNTTNIPYSNLVNLTSQNDRLNVTICAFVTASGKKSYLAHYMNSSADSFVILPNQTYDTGPPQWSSNATNFTSPVIFKQNAGYRFNTTWADNFAMSTVLIEHNFSGGSPQNYTVTTKEGDVYYYDYGNIQPGVYAWREYANDTSNNWNLTDKWIVIVYNTSLQSNLATPDSTKTTYVTQNQKFVVNATIYCRTYPAGNSCGDIYGTAMYNSSSINPNTPMNTTQGDKPFYVQENPAQAKKACPANPLDDNEFCNTTWIVNATGNINTYWKIGVLVNSSITEVRQNFTENATVSISACTEDISLAWTTIDFGSLNPSTNYNNATYNGQNFYNITNKGTCTLNLWIKGTDLENSTWNSKISVGNFSWSNTTNDYHYSYNMTNSYVLLNRSLPSNQNLTTYYWLSVPPVYYGFYNGSVYICGNSSSTC